MKTISERLTAHNDALAPLLEELRQALVKVVNGRGDIAEFLKAIERLEEFRQFINSAEKIGFVVGIDHWRVAAFPLTGDPQQDAGQTDLNLPKNKMN